MPQIKKQSVKKKVTKKPAGKKKGVKKGTATKPTFGNILDQAQPVEFSENEGIKINLFGASGTGKTTLWGTFPKPILCIVCSGGKKPGELRSLDAETRAQVQQMQITSAIDLHDIAAAAAESQYHATIVVDHISGLQDLAVCEVGGLDEAPAQGSWGLLEQQQWGQVALQVKESLRALLSLSCNVVLIAQERVFNSEDPMIKPFIASALTPSTVGWLNPAVDYICQTFIQPKTVKTVIEGTDEVIEETTDEMEYCLRVSPHHLIASKFRKPKGDHRPQYIVDPTYDKIMDLING